MVDQMLTEERSKMISDILEPFVKSGERVRVLSEVREDEARGPTEIKDVVDCSGALVTNMLNHDIDERLIEKTDDRKYRLSTAGVCLRYLLDGLYDEVIVLNRLELFLSWTSSLGETDFPDVLSHLADANVVKPDDLVGRSPMDDYNDWPCLDASIRACERR